MNVPVVALRNLGRYPLRTALIVLATAVTGAVMLVWGSLGAGFIRTLQLTATGLELGEFQVHQPDYLDSRNVYDVMKDADTLARSVDEVGFFVTSRLYSNALAASGDLSAGVGVRALSVESEKRVTRIHEHVARGEWLTPGAAKDVVIGKSLAEALHLDVGAALIILGHGLDGSLASEIFHVRGILQSINKDIDFRGVFMTAETFRVLFLLEDGVHELAARRKDAGWAIGDAEARLVGAAGPGLRVHSWRELRPVLARMLDILGLTVYFSLGMAYFALGGLILNVMLMTVFDRMREYGVMKAVGMPPQQVVRLILAEAGWLAVVAAALTVVLGVPFALYYQRYGMDFRFLIDRMAFAGLIVEPVLFGVVGLKQVIAPVAFLVVMMPLAALYPALKAASVEPVEALYRSH